MDEDLAPSLALGIELPPRYRGWLSEQLRALGFPAFEEQSRPRSARILIYDASESRLEAVAAAVREQARLSLPGVALKFSLERPNGDWALEWTRHLTPVQLTPSIRLYPAAPPEGALDAGALYLEPAFAFGFGEHPSTRLVATWLEAWCREHPGASVLDVGCGTGVLSLVALRAGAGSVLGVDTSPAAVAAAQCNAALNALDRARFERGSAEHVTARFDCVVANIEAQILEAACDGIIDTLAQAGVIALSGFIEEQVAGLAEHYRARGVALERTAEDGDWCLLVGRRL
jgi:ribosomal protein L11 methyltransferase